jgi:hypothetical protein
MTFGFFDAGKQRAGSFSIFDFRFSISGIEGSGFPAILRPLRTRAFGFRIIEFAQPWG